MQPNRIPFAVAALLVLVVSGLQAQGKNNHVSWELLTPTISGKPGEVVDVKIRLTTAPSAHLYTLRGYEDSIVGPRPTEITAGDSTLLTLTGEVSSDVPAKQKMDPNFDDLPTEYWEGTVTLTIPVRIAGEAKPGEHRGWTNVYFMSCTDRLCRPPSDERFEITVRVAGR